MSRAVPRDLSATVNVDHRRAVCGAFEILGALARGVDRGMLEEYDRVGPQPVCDGSMGCALKLKGFEVRHGVGA